jgi:hypothetical protein
MHAETTEDLQELLANLREIDSWQNIGDDEWTNVPAKSRSIMWDRHVEERIVSFVDDLMDVRFMPTLDEAGDFVQGQVTVWLEPISWLAEQHRETIQEIINEVLDAYAPGYWEVEDWDALYEFPKNGIVVTLVGHSA